MREAALSQIYLLQLASQEAKWLSARQSTVANNIANANTPGFRAMDVKPFSDVLANTDVAMAATNPAHMTSDPDDGTATRSLEADSWDATLSGNSISLEQELMKEGDINRSFTLNTNVKRAFHQMLMSSLK
jgi:flagellar basal-body rod protein FlgB